VTRVEECVACGGSGILGRDSCFPCGGRGYRDVDEEDWTARRWTPERIIERFHAWVAIHGAPPSHSDWSPSKWRRAARASRRRLRVQLERAARYEEGEWPSTWAVSDVLGSWGAMFTAAGYERRPVGRPRAGEPDVAVRLEDRELSRKGAASVRYAADRPGPDELATRVRHVARARAGDDPAALRAALYQLAATAVAWIDLLDNEREDAA
jgi:hypothetical protein